MTRTVAIDFGTSRTKVAYWSPRSNQPELMRFALDRPFLPSLFYLARDSERILWGSEAEEMLARDPTGIVEVLKRRLQERYIRANRRQIAPGDLLARFFAYLRERTSQ